MREAELGNSGSFYTKIAAILHLVSGRTAGGRRLRAPKCHPFLPTCYLILVVRCDVNSPSSGAIQTAARAIQRGQLVLHPTDTIYGLACDPLNPEALDRLFSLKGRSPEKGVLMMIPKIDLCEAICDDIPEVFHKFAARLWPGPVTLLLRGKTSLPDLLLGSEGKVGLRHPDLPFLQLWMEEIPGAIASTSANRSGQSPPASLEELRQLLGDEVDLFLEGEEIEVWPQPSTVVDLTLDPPRLVRSGQWAARVERCLKS